MHSKTVMIVEDEFLVALDVEQELTAAGYEVVGTASSEREAIEMADATVPERAIVDVNLAPGDGRRVAKVLAARHSTSVLMASANPDTIGGRAATGAVAQIPKPYSAALMPAAMEALDKLTRGEDAGRLPDSMAVLK